MNSALDPTTPREALLATPVRELGLSVEHSPVAPFVRRLVRELRDKGIRRFSPAFYLTDEWGCPSGQPIIGVPFYLGHPTLARIERERNDLENAREIMMYLRHEAGHSFNYAYRLYREPEWRATFGPYRRPYRDDYRPVPFSRAYVRHLPGWYAQKHPDEDFAETFAVWLTPRSKWRTRYQGWPSMAKLEFVDRTARSLGDKDPIVARGTADFTVEEMDATVGQVFDESAARNRASLALADNEDLLDMFLPGTSRRKNTRPAWEIVEEHRRPLTDKIAHWTGVRRPVVRSLIDSIVAACRAQGLKGI